jgi:hypothetical protein
LAPGQSRASVLRRHFTLCLRTFSIRPIYLPTSPSPRPRLATRWCCWCRPLNPPIRQPFQLQVSLKADQWWVESCSAASPEVWRSIRWLLHLPSLRAVWEMQLRAARFEQLRLRVRPLWFMDEADPPPGTVIHHLNAASWHEVEQRLGPGGDLQAVAERWVEHRYALANSVSLAYVASADGRVSLASA